MITRNRRLFIVFVSTLSFVSTSFADRSRPPAATFAVGPSNALPQIAAEQFFFQAQQGIDGKELLKSLKIFFPKKADQEFADSLAKQGNRGKVYIDALKRESDSVSFLLPDGRKIKLDFRRFESGIVLLNAAEIRFGKNRSLKDLLAQISRALDGGKTASAFYAIFIPRAKAMWHIFLAPLVLAMAAVNIAVIKRRHTTSLDQRASDEVMAMKQLHSTCEADLANPGPYPNATEKALSELKQQYAAADPKIREVKLCKPAFFAFVYAPTDGPKDVSEFAEHAQMFCLLADEFNRCAEKLLAVRKTEPNQRPEKAAPAGGAHP